MKAIIDAVWAEAAMLLAVVANSLLIVAVTGPGWGRSVGGSSVSQVDTLGLWKVCTPPDSANNELVHCHPLGPYHLPGWYKAVQGLVTASTLGLMLTFTFIMMFACISRFKDDRRLLVVYTVNTIIFNMIGIGGIILFGERIRELVLGGTHIHVGWCFVIAVTAFSIHLLGVILLIVELIVGRWRRPASPETRPVIPSATNIASLPPGVALESVA